MADWHDDRLTINDKSPGLGWIPTRRQIAEFSGIIKSENDRRDRLTELSAWDKQREGHDDGSFPGEFGT